MKGKVVWLAVSCLMVASLLLASCAPAVVEEKKVAPPKEKEVVTEEETVTFEQPFSIGETAQTSSIAVTVLDAIITDSYQYYDPVAKETSSKQASPGMSFLIATVEVKNVGGATTNEGKFRWYALDSEVPRYDAGSYLGEGVFASNRKLSPGGKLSGKVLFEIRPGATGLKMGYTRSHVTPEPLAEWTIK